MEHKILVVDDEANMLVLLKRALSRQGYQVACAESAQDGLSLASRTTFSLAIVDVIMPAMDGFSLMKKLIGLNRHMPVIAISAQASSAREKQARDLGCACFLTKPIDIKQLKTIISSLLSTSSVEGGKPCM